MNRTRTRPGATALLGAITGAGAIAGAATAGTIAGVATAGTRGPR